MSRTKGIMVLMGSGELTATMVEVYKELLSRLGTGPNAVFLNTPAGFQLNADEISKKASDYFRRHVGHPLNIVSYKSAQTRPYDAEQAFHALKQADFILIGPGSPTYALRQWKQSPIPEIFSDKLNHGGCLVVASAAALTAGAFTLPVYEIYKVGEDLKWIDGLDILGKIGFKSVVVPHWNNAEGGTHDTRFCFMGKSRFDRLKSLLPPEIVILGIDEHTAFIMDLESQTVEIKGIGTVTIQRNGEESVFEKGDGFPIAFLTDGTSTHRGKVPSIRENQPEAGSLEEEFWNTIHRIESQFEKGVTHHDPKMSANALLELDQTLWKAHEDLIDSEYISQSREILREFMVTLGTQFGEQPDHREKGLKPLIDEFLDLRSRFRKQHQWREADEIRDCLLRQQIIVEDTPEGTRWKLEV